jgi:hypothetical protein
VRPLSRRERWLLRVFGVVATMAVVVVAAINVLGGPMGARCRDSYDCRGFLVGGAECVDTERGAYCTRTCRKDDECPTGWRCLEANPTALTVETRAVARACVRDP